MRCETSNTEPAVETDDKLALSEAAKRRLLSVKGEPLFLADWLRPVFIHAEVPCEMLQRSVPFPLDLHEGKAYVSLVAFTMRRMRPRIGGRLAAFLLRPIAANDFLNVRTYVRHRGESGIYFLTEWMNNRVSVRLGPITFGLPYCLGKMNYQHADQTGIFSGTVRDDSSGTSLGYRCIAANNGSFTACPAESLDEFLLERYTAFTAHGTIRRFFRIWHPPWKQTPLDVSIIDGRL